MPISFHIDFNCLLLPSPITSIVVNLRPLTLTLLQSTLDESSPPNSLLCTLCMQDRGHISKCSDAQSNKDRHTHTCAVDPGINQWCRGLTQGLGFISLLPSLSRFYCLLYGKKAKRKINQVCIWRSLLPCHLGDEGASEWEPCGRGEVEERGNSQEGRRQHRHSWGVNRNNHSFLSALLDSGPKCPGGGYDPES